MMENLAVLLLCLLCLASVTSAQTADVEVRIDEELAVGSFVVNVSEYPALFPEVTPDNRNKLTYNILDKSSAEASFFGMNSASGTLFVAKRLDRERVCGNVVDCALQLNVAIQGTGSVRFSNIASVKVHVDDINDNAPSFPTDQMELEISEAAKVGYVLKLNGPQDLDSLPNNTIQRYETTLKEPVFTVSDTKNPDGSTILNLRLESGLDRETIARYDFNIIVYDGGKPPKSDFLHVIIHVTDDNDNAPEFESKSYTINIREDTEPGAEIVRVRAHDKDAGQFGEVNFRFSNRLVPDSPDTLFEINSTTGSISLKYRIDHASGDSPYNLVVEAFDGGDPPSVAQATVTINVLNTGNNAPLVRIVTVSEGDSADIFLPESAQVDDFVAFVTVDDTDEGKNGDVTCSIMNDRQFRLVALPNKGYKVLLGRAVDREMVSSYDGVIVCRDGGSPSLSTETPFTVVITDVNDNDPRFDQTDFSVSVPENNGEGQYLLQVSASDRDSGTNSAITYGLLESQAPVGYVSVHPQSGIVTARVSLDRETTPILRYTLTAVDGGEPSRTGTARLTITIGDMNDNSPQLLGTPYLFFVSEGASPGQLVGSMSATDADTFENGEVEFFFAGSVNGEVPFLVHTNGTLEVSGVLDRENSESYVFTVLARDKGTVPRSNSTQVTVRVMDINDNAPVILFPTNVNHSVVITTTPEQGVTLGRVIAYDVDEGNASSLLYAIHAGDTEGVFEISREKGEIYLVDLNRLRNPHTYQVVLRVYDLGVPSLFAETSLQIEVNFPNVTRPGAGGYGHGHSGGKTGEAEEQEQEKARESYVIIVGIIGGATLVLSGIIIGAIFFVLRSERNRKPRDSVSVFKNDYVPAPTGVGIPVEKLDSDGHRVIPSSPPPDSGNFFHAEVPVSGVVLSPNSLPTQKTEVQKKVSFSFDEPDGDERQFQSPEMLLVPLPHSNSQQEELENPNKANWKRVASPDDLNSDTSGDSGTCDSGRGASDDDIHLDNSIDKHSGIQNSGAPPMTNTNRTPARATANIYSHPTNTASFSTFRGSQGQGQHAGQGQGNTHDASEGFPGPASRPRFLHTTGSYHEGRNDNYYRKGQGPHPRTTHPHHHRAGPYHHPHPQHQRKPYQQQVPPTVSLHPEQSPWGQTGSRHSLDFVDTRDAYFPPRSASSLSSAYPYQRQGSVGTSGGGEEDAASTTTSGSYTISPDDLRGDAGLIGSDVIV